MTLANPLGRLLMSILPIENPSGMFIIRAIIRGVTSFIVPSGISIRAIARLTILPSFNLAKLDVSVGAGLPAFLLEPLLVPIVMIGKLALSLPVLIPSLMLPISFSPMTVSGAESTSSATLAYQSPVTPSFGGSGGTSPSLTALTINRLRSESAP